uniref:Uncharacterized protein n=1 Tax=Cacopsylla melanoneura TaxID=428564 RepID=A0A8D8U161_9HEMI
MLSALTHEFQWTECTAVALNVLKRQVTSLFTNSLDLVYMVPTTTDVYVSRIFPKHSPLEQLEEVFWTTAPTTRMFRKCVNVCFHDCPFHIFVNIYTENGHYVNRILVSFCKVGITSDLVPIPCGISGSLLRKNDYLLKIIFK